MKKGISITTIIVLLVMGLFILTGCGNDNGKNTGRIEDGGNKNSGNLTDSQQGENIDLSEYIGTKTGKFYSQFTSGKMYMEYEMEYAGQKTKVISATNGQKIYSENIIDGQSAGIAIIDGTTMYTIDHENKLIVKMNDIPSGGNMLTSTIIEEEDVDMGDLKTGTRTIDGKTYNTEELTVDNTKVIMCFDGSNLAYMISEFDGEEMIIKLIKISTSVDDKLFEIPSDYEVVEM